MKWNNPATWLMGGTVLAVGLMALAGSRKSKLAKANADCSRITLLSEDKWLDALTEEFTYVNASADPQATAQGSLDRLLQGVCNGPIPTDAVLETFDGRELFAGDVRQMFIDAANDPDPGASAGGCRRCLGVR